MKLCIVGATGLVGRTIIKVLEENNFPVDELFLVASINSVGKEIIFRNKIYRVIGIEDAVKLKPDIAIFSAGSLVSKRLAPEFVKAGTTVIDNSSAWRMYPDIKLIVPEINAYLLTRNDKIIANPNCSTIQMVVALAPLHRKFKLKRIVISTYQSVTGTGQKAIEQMENERRGINGEPVYPHPIDKNCFPFGGGFLDNDYTTEEMKLVNETHKILDDSTIRISPTVVRVPVLGGHSESVNAEFEKDFSVDEVKQIFSSAKGIVVQDEPAKHIYPMPLYSAGKNEVFVGRIRKDLFQPKTLNLWIVADNLRKGAATNAVQIAEYLCKNFI